MKKRVFTTVAATVLATAIAFGGALTVPQFAKTAYAAGSNVSITTAEEIQNNTWKEGSFTKDDPKGERWYKFTNYTNKDVVAEISITKTQGCASSKYAVLGEIGEGEKKSGSFDTDGEKVYIGMKPGETNHLRVYDPGWDTAWIAAVKINEEEPNSIAKSVKVKSGKRIHGKLDYTTDVDVYKIKAKKTGTMTIKISNNGITGGSLEYKIYNKSRVSKAHANVEDTETGVKKMKVKKGQYVYVEIKGYNVTYDRELGEYSIMTKIK